jgi:hypothetical protein
VLCHTEVRQQKSVAGDGLHEFFAKRNRVAESAGGHVQPGCRVSRVLRDRKASRATRDQPVQRSHCNSDGAHRTSQLTL